MSEQHRKKLADEYKQNQKHPEYKIYYDEFYKETDAIIEEKEDYPEENINLPPEERKPKTKKGKKK